jgi:hypothetical protein
MLDYTPNRCSRQVGMRMKRLEMQKQSSTYIRHRYLLSSRRHEQAKGGRREREYVVQPKIRKPSNTWI